MTIEHSSINVQRATLKRCPVFGKEIDFMHCDFKGVNYNAFTDWTRLRAEYGEEWEGMTQPVSGMIGMMDVVININSEAELGCYIDQKIFDEINNQQK